MAFKLFFSGFNAAAAIPDIGVVLLCFTFSWHADVHARLPADVPAIAGAPALSGNPAFDFVHILAVVPAFVITSVLSNQWIPNSYYYYFVSLP